MTFIIGLMVGMFIAIPIVIVTCRRTMRTHKQLAKTSVEWVVNDSAELGIKIGNQFFWLYKGESLVYGSHHDTRRDDVCVHDDGTPMHWRRVLKREFGECCHPINLDDPSKYGTVSLNDGKEWKPLPSPSVSLE